MSRRITKGDVVIIPGHTPHWWSELETDIRGPLDIGGSESAQPDRGGVRAVGPVRTAPPADGRLDALPEQASALEEP